MRRSKPFIRLNDDMGLTPDEDVLPANRSDFEILPPTGDEGSIFVCVRDANTHRFLRRFRGSSAINANQQATHWIEELLTTSIPSLD